jgi:hypothetical protein
MLDLLLAMPQDLAAAAASAPSRRDLLLKAAQAAQPKQVRCMQCQVIRRVRADLAYLIVVSPDAISYASSQAAELDVLLHLLQ